MIKRTLLCAVLLCSCFATAFAQTIADDQRNAKANEIVDKAQKLDILNQVLPILLTKDQLKQLLPAIEKARQNVRDTEKKDAEDLKLLETKLDAAIADGLQKGTVPPLTLIGEVATTFSNISKRRSAIADLNAQDVQEVFNKVANPGQKKTVANSLDVKKFVPMAKVEDWKDDDKVFLFCKEILLHPLAYDLLVKMST